MTGSALVPIAVLGAGGRMGRSLMRLAAEHGARVVAAIDRAEAGRDAGELAGAGRSGLAVAADLGGLKASGAKVLIDFSSPAVVAEAARACADAGVALVSGTTGLEAEGTRALDAAAGRVAVLWEPNMSVGVLVLSDLLRSAIALLGPGFDVEIVETHHRLKADAPSGTAARLAEIAKDEVGKRGEGAPVLVKGRDGKPGARRPNEIGVLAVRGGDVVGDHVVHLLGEGERLELVHRASSRDVFAVGALRAAAWLAGKPAGRYALRDVVKT